MRPTASKIGRLSACQWWAREGVPWVDHGSAAADLGTRVHAAIEADLTGRWRRVDDAVEPYVRSYVAWRDRVRGETLVATERPLALDLATGDARELPRGEHREYVDRQPSDVVGTADTVWVDSDDGYVVDDIKTGRPENVDDVTGNAQMRTLGLLWARHLKVDNIRVRLVFVSPFQTYAESTELDAFDLDAWEGRLQEWERTIPQSEPTPGSHCRYCPAAAACPVATQAIATVEPTRTRLPVVARSADITSPAHARDQYETLRAVKAATDQAWEALRRWVDEHGPVDVGEGRTYGARTITRESVALDTPEALEVLRSRLGPAWEAAVDVSTSKAAIKAAARVAAEATGGKAGAIERTTLDALRAVGAIRSKTTSGYDER
jgi:hypothetical protein